MLDLRSELGPGRQGRMRMDGVQEQPLRPAVGFAWHRRAASLRRRAEDELRELRDLAALIHERSPRVVIAVPGDDVHVVANRISHRLLAALGYRVSNLGVMASLDHIVSACTAEPTALVVLSSLNGHARHNCADLPRRLAGAGLRVPVYIGGNLNVGGRGWLDVRREF